MEVADWLNIVLKGCHLLASPEQIIQLVPDVCVDAPPFWSIEGEKGEDVQHVVPVACTPALGQPVTDAVAEALRQGVREGEREDFAGLSPEDWATDPLAAALARLVIEANLVSRQASAIPFLEVSRLACGLLAGRAPRGTGKGAAGLAIERQLSRMSELEPHRQGKILADVAWSLSARCGAAWGLASQLDASLQPTRFYQAMMRSKLSFMLGPQQEGKPDTAMVMGALGLPGEPADVDIILDLTEKALLGIEKRIREGKASEADLNFNASTTPSFSVPLSEQRRARIGAHVPGVAATYLQRLADFTSAKELVASGLSKDKAKQLLDPQIARSLAANLRDLLKALQLWDLFSCLQQSLQAADAIGVTWWKKGPFRHVLVPRGDTGTTTTNVVAIRLTELRNAASQAAARNGEGLCPAGAEAQWRRVVRRAAERKAHCFETSTHAFFLLPTAHTAQDFSTHLLKALPSPLSLQLSPLGPDLDVSAGISLSIGIATGTIYGGTDGQRSTICGPAIDEALHMAGVGTPVSGDGDPAGIRHAQLTVGGLYSRGMVATPAFIEALREEHRSLGRPFRAPGETPIAGVHAPFEGYHVPAAQERADGSVCVLLPLHAQDDRTPVELLEMSSEEFQDFHQRDKGLDPAACQPSLGSMPESPPPPPVGESFQSPAPSQTAAADPFQDSFAEGEELPAFDLADQEDDEDEEYEFEIDTAATNFATDNFTLDEDQEEDDPFDDISEAVMDSEEGVLVLDEDPDEKAAPTDFASMAEEFTTQGEEESSEAAEEPIFDAFSVEPTESEQEEDPFALDWGDDQEAGSDPFGFDEGLDEPEEAATPSQDETSDFASPAPGEAQSEEPTTLGFLPPADMAIAEEEEDEAPLGYLPPAAEQAADQSRAPAPAAAPALAPHGAKLAPPAPPPASPPTAPKPAPPSTPQPTAAPIGDSAAPAPPAVHERPTPAPPAQSGTNPTLMPASRESLAAATPPKLEPAPRRVPPQMPASLLALIGEEEEEPAEQASFQFLGTSTTPTPSPEPAPAPRPPAPEPEPPAPEPAPEPPAPEPAPEPPAPELQPEPPAVEPDPFDFGQLDSPELDEEQVQPSDDPPGADFADFDDADINNEEPAGDFESLFADDEDEDESFDESYSSMLSYHDDEEDEEQDPFQQDVPDSGEEEDAEEDGAEQDEDDVDIWGDAPAAMEEPEPDVSAPDESLLQQEPPSQQEFPVQQDLPVEPEPPVQAAQPAAAAPAPAPSPPIPGVEALFAGYQVYLTESNAVLFGHRYGSHLLDAHEYPCGDDINEAYKRFLKDKIDERFVPRSDLSRPVPKGTSGQAMDMERLATAYQLLNSGGDS